MKNYIKQCGLSLLVLAFLVSVATGCKNTAQGAGKDIENMGEKIQEKTK
jgi:predicted small secreted protein